MLQAFRPKCGKNSGLKCRYCELNSDETDKARQKRLASKTFLGETTNRELPKNCYTQKDCDAYTERNGFQEFPNPAWIADDQSYGDCFPACLFNKQSPATCTWAEKQVEWAEMLRNPEPVKEQNRKARGGQIVTTPSDVIGRRVPAGLSFPVSGSASTPTKSPPTASQSAPLALGMEPVIPGVSSQDIHIMRQTMAVEEMNTTIKTVFKAGTSDLSAPPQPPTKEAWGPTLSDFASHDVTARPLPTSTAPAKPALPTHSTDVQTDDFLLKDKRLVDKKCLT